MADKEYISPVYNIKRVPFEKIVPNTYNPNTVAPPEMKLLYDSIKEDGYTMPIVCYYVKAQDIYVIVDGFHRWRVMKDYPDIYEREKGHMPVSVIDKSLSNRMASTIRHNRARGSHDVDLMSNIIKELHEVGRSDAWISKHLGMDKDEILRLKQITGLAALFRDVKFGQAWRPVENEEFAQPRENAFAALSQVTILFFQCARKSCFDFSNFTFPSFMAFCSTFSFCHLLFRCQGRKFPFFLVSVNVTANAI